MKKITLIVFALLGIFIIWNTPNDEKTVSIQIEEKEKKVEVATLFETDLNKTIVFSPVEKIIVDIGKDRNTTKETNLTLEANLTNYNEEYHYIWKEKNIIVGTGKVLTKSYTKGKHLLNVEVFLGASLVGEDEVLVTAWDYVKIEMFFKFEKEEGEMKLSSTKILNHLNQLLLSSWGSSKTLYKYTDFNKILEKNFEYFKEPKRNTTTFYYYDSDHNLSSIEEFNYEGTLVSTKKYDKSGNEIVKESKEKSRYVETRMKYKKVRNEDGNLTHVSWTSGDVEHIRNMQYDNGKMVFMEYLYGQRKNTVKYDYNDNGQVTLRKSSRFDEEGVKSSENIWKMVYNDIGDVVQKEFIQSYGDIVASHRIETFNYEDGLLKSSENNALVGICPCSSDEIQQKVEYRYDENNNKIGEKHTSKKKDKARLEQDAKNRKTVRTYTNELMI